MPTKNIRLRIILLLSLFICLGLSTRIIFLSLKNIDEYDILETNNYNVKRGDILDRNGLLLAVSDELESVYANTFEIKSIENISFKLSKILNIPQQEIKYKLKQKKNFIWIKRQINPKQAALIKKLKLKGIGLKKEYKRFYPNKELASHVVGFCNIDSRGQEGIEKGMDVFLTPDLSNIKYENEENDIKGSDVILTIDANIQAFSDIILKESVLKENADSGSLIMADGRSGEILCMSNYPNYNPNDYKEYKQSIFRNYAIFNQFEPGSVFKIFSLASLLDKDLIDETDFYYCDGKYVKDNVTVKCTGIHGSVNYNGILKYSCNDGMLQASSLINPVDFYYYLKSFGFGMRTTIKLPGEQSGILRDIDKWTDRSMMSIPLGQEVSVNSLQIIRAATTFVNDGIMLEPYIVKAVFENNKIKYSKSRKEVRRVIKKGISEKVLSAMSKSTDTGGTASTLYLESLNFAAKSGTAQIYDPDLNMYLDNYFTSSLLVIFPLNNPRYIIYIVFHKPRGNIKWGGVIGSKTINNFLSHLTGYIDLNMQYDYVINEKNLGVNKKYQYIKVLPVNMPDLSGLSACDVIDIFSKVDVEIRVFGTGRVYKQLPEAGNPVNKNDEIKIYLKNY